MSRPTVIFDIVETGAVAAIGVLAALTEPRVWWLVACGALFLASKAFRFVVSGSQRKQLKRSALEAQLKMMNSFISNPTNSEIRITFHKEKGRRRYQQVVDYIPDGGGSGRVQPQSKGIVGRAFNLKQVQVESFNNAAEYREKMINKYNYTPDEVKQRSIDRRSYCAWPMVNTHMDVLGVVYLDSPHPGVFTRPGDPDVLATIDRACRKMMEYLR